jgi:LPXTG-motif cell wall-anchored protein
VAGDVVEQVTVTPDDNVEVQADGTTKALAYTGAPSIPMVLGGIVLLGAGGALIMVSRQRRRQARA